MKIALPAACALCLLLPGALSAGLPLPTTTKSVSETGQFVIYSDDVALRLAVSSYCEETKSGIQDFLGIMDATQRSTWKVPIVITFFHADAASPDQPVVQCFPRNVEGGGRRIELDVTLRGNLTDVHFQQQVVKTILLEMEYHDQPEFKAPIIDPPQWLVEGLSVYLKSRKADLDVDVYQSLLTNSDLPKLADFLSETTADMNTSSLGLYQAYAYSFLQLLAGLPQGQRSLGLYIHDLPLGKDAPSEDLMKHFPALGGSPDSLEKWWTLSMARLAASDRYRGLSLDETEQHLTALLKFHIPTDKSGKTTKDFTIEDYKQFEKNPQAQPVLEAANSSLQYFATQANPLYRPVVADYMMIIEQLRNGKTGKVAGELSDVAEYRKMVLKRMDDIADYLNWFEATQIASRSNSFDDYLKSGKDVTADKPKRNDAISRYLDSMEIQMQ